MKGILTISLDFEMAWGMHDRPNLTAYRPNLLGERAVVARLLEVFQRHEIHATWATVGFLFFSTKEALMRHSPAQRPEYANPAFSPYRLFDQLGADEASDPTHFAGSLVTQIAEVAGQEIGTHTFSHYFCLEPGQTLAAFREDLRAAMTAAEERGWKLTSLVFPRNQCNESYLAVCREFGIRAYRGNESSWMYRAANGEQEHAWRRAARLIDAYLPLSGANTYPLASIAKTPPLNVPSSRFLRPYLPSLKILEPLRLHRILHDLRHAAKTGEVYHLWWHPHNFGIHQEENFAFLERILAEFDRLRRAGRMESLTMQETAERV